MKQQTGTNTQDSFLESIESILNRRKFSTHRSIRKFLQSNNFCVNGMRITNSSHKVSLFKDSFTLNGSPFILEKDLYLILNKTKGFICTTKDNLFPTVYSLIDKKYFEKIPAHSTLHTIGRLDLDTEGLLLFTTNGDFSHRLLNPEFHVEKKYYIKLEKNVTAEEQSVYKQKCKEGIFIERENNQKGFRAGPALISFISENECYLTISEGKFHQVKRMIKALQNKVTYLKRVQFASLCLPQDLKPNEYRELTEEEILLLTKKSTSV